MYYCIADVPMLMIMETLWKHSINSYENNLNFNYQVVIKKILICGAIYIVLK